MTRREHRCSTLHFAWALGTVLVAACGGKVSGPRESSHIDGERDPSGSGGTLGIGGTLGSGGTPGVGGMTGVGGTTGVGGSTGDGGTAGVGGSSALTCSVGSFLSELPPPALGSACEPCPDATWDHDANSASECISWSACPDGFVETAPGTPTSDRVCKAEPWIRQFGTEGADSVYSIGADTEGNVFVAGHTMPANYSVSEAEAFVRKFDGAGNEVWARHFGTSDLDVAYALAVDTHGSVIVAGYTKGAFVGFTNAGDNDAFVRKYDAAGQELWTKQFGSEKADDASGVAVGDNDEILVVGTTGGSLAGQMGVTDAFARKYDTLGNELWTRQFGSATSDYATGVSIDGDGNVLISGQTAGELPGHTSAGYFDAFVCKYDAAGNELWTRQFGTEDSDSVGGVATDAEGNVIIVGQTYLVALPGQVAAGSWDAFARKYDASGSELWTRQFGTSDYDYADAVAVDEVGNVIVAGATTGIFPGQSIHDGTFDTFVRKYDGAGSELWTQQFGSSGGNTGGTVCTDAYGRIFVAGDTFGAFPQQSSLGSYDGFIIRVAE